MALEDGNDVMAVEEVEDIVGVAEQEAVDAGEGCG